MTHARTPRTFADAMTIVAGALGYAEAGRHVGRTSRAIYDWANPATDTAPSIAQALVLDAAFRASGGGTSPFLDAFAFQLDVTLDRQEACGRALAAEIATASREFGEAVATALALVNSTPSPLAVQRAFAEVSNAAEAVDVLQRRVAGFLTSGAGPVAG